jgi:hypothetical protein
MPGARIRHECLALAGAAVAGGALGGTFGAQGVVPMTVPDHPPYEEIEQRLTALLPIAIPAVTVSGMADGSFPATDHQPLRPPPHSRRSS